MSCECVITTAPSEYYELRLRDTEFSWDGTGMIRKFNGNGSENEQRLERE